MSIRDLLQKELRRGIGVGLLLLIANVGLVVAASAADDDEQRGRDELVLIREIQGDVLAQAHLTTVLMLSDAPGDVSGEARLCEEVRAGLAELVERKARGAVAPDELAALRGAREVFDRLHDDAYAHLEAAQRPTRVAEGPQGASRRAVAYAVQLELGVLHPLERAAASTTHELGAAAHTSSIYRAVQIALLVASLALIIERFVVTSSRIRQMLTRRLEELMEGIERLKAGDLDSPVRMQGDDELALVGAALNTTAASLHASREALVLQIEALGHLAGSVSHELRNPLGAIRNATTYLQRKLQGNEPPRIPQFLELIDREVTTCTRFIEDVLDFARDRPPVLAPCPLGPLVDEVIELLGETGHAVVNDVPPALPALLVDKHQFRQVLTNLVKNANEAIDPGDGAGRVRVTAEGGGVLPWTIVVEDTGSGIDPSVVGRLFEPLVTAKDKGTGLGLSIVAKIVERHGGAISAHPNEPRGARFVVVLPPHAPGAS